MICGGSEGQESKIKLVFIHITQSTFEIVWVQSHIEEYDDSIIIRDGTCVHSHFIIGERFIFTVTKTKDSRSIKWLI